MNMELTNSIPQVSKFLFSAIQLSQQRFSTPRGTGAAHNGSNFKHDQYLELLHDIVVILNDHFLQVH